MGYEPVRLRPGAVIDCKDPMTLSRAQAILFDRELIPNLKGEYAAFVDMSKYAQTMHVGVSRSFFQYRPLLPRDPQRYEPKKWGAYEWVGVWNYAVLGTATALIFLLLRLGGLI